MGFDYLISDYLFALDALALFAAIAILISSLDDLFIDVYFWSRELYRWVFVTSRYPPLRIEDLYAREQKPFAIMVPAWKEYDVIARMVENTLATLDYQNYVIFIGTYQNDAETTAEADRMARRYPQMVRRATVLNDGPTCKADCLNWIVQSIALHEETEGMRFAGVIMHDCEDVIHPLELYLYNYLIDRKDLIQLPVLSLEREWYEFVAGTYLDDFSEWHCKEMVVREAMTGVVPGSGVATCYSRHAIDELAKHNDNMPFNTDTLTEDYEMSHRLKKIGTRQVFVRFPVRYKARRRSFFTRKENLVETSSLIATREYFPGDFRSAYRQRARWITGVAFQGWEQMGWKGDWVHKYLYMRDRKGIFTSFVGLLAYFVALNLLLLFGLKLAGHDYLRFLWMSQTEGALFFLFELNFWLFVNRACQRVFFVFKLNGLEQGLLSIPRMVVSNVINFFAVCRAWKLFLTYFITGKRITWDKTQHIYPSMDELKRQRSRIGRLLLEWDVIREDHLNSALMVQKKLGKKLGALLLEKGVVGEETLADAVAQQAGLPRAHLGLEAVKAYAGRVPRYMVRQYRVVPFATGEGGALNLAIAEPLDNEALSQIRRQIGDEVALFVVTESELSEALAWYAIGLMKLLKRPDGKRLLLGDVLLGMGLMSIATLTEYLGDYDPRRDGKVGAWLVRQGAITQDELDRALAEQSRSGAAGGVTK
jgi:adsorption protein B